MMYTVLAMMYIHWACGSHVSASQGYVYMWVYVSITCQECHTKVYAGVVITQCIALAGPQSYTRQH